MASPTRAEHCVPGGPRRRLGYTFGNHMHWVDMQWLWGRHVLPGSVRDMLAFMDGAGVRGNVNFDVAGYERMAAESPAALDALREAVRSGRCEVVGASYAQPYGQFDGLESSIRQLAHGVLGVLALFGVRPRTFWEEEFWCFPQLPQVLAGCGFTRACLFFQWTWHTPELPVERSALIRWASPDGTSIPALPRNDLNVHQWPEEFETLLSSGLIGELDEPVVVQWLELMPSPDWMCRSELLLPRMRELAGDGRFELVAGTVGEHVERLAASAAREGREVPVRAYEPDEMWHGMTLGKNGGGHPWLSRYGETGLRAAEAVATTASLLGRPYASWDVYPAWELEESWKLLLIHQHHDNHECEGLCGFIGRGHAEASIRMSEEVSRRTRAHLFDRAVVRAGGEGPSELIVNPLGVPRLHRGMLVPAFGYGVGRPGAEPPATRWRGLGEAGEDGRHAAYEWSEPGAPERGWRIAFDPGALGLSWIERFDGGVVRRMAGRPLVSVASRIDGAAWRAPATAVIREGRGAAGLEQERTDDEGRRVRLGVAIVDGGAGVGLSVSIDGDVRSRIDPGYGGAWRLVLDPGAPVDHVVADQPGSFHRCRGTGVVRRKYPTGDWMTTPQWFESMERAVMAGSVFGVVPAGGEPGVLWAQVEATRQGFITGRGLEIVLDARDPWDERRVDDDTLHASAVLRFAWAGEPGLSCASLVRSGWWCDPLEGDPSGVIIGEAERRDLPSPVGGGGASAADRVPRVFAPLELRASDGVVATSLRRAAPHEGEHLPEWCGHAMARASGGACTHPLALRLVEMNGEPEEVELALAGPVASACLTNLLGEVGAGIDRTGWLEVVDASSPGWWDDADPCGFRWQSVRFRMAPHQIATVMWDAVPGRKRFRDLDAKREVWARVHRTGPG